LLSSQNFLVLRDFAVPTLFDEIDTLFPKETENNVELELMDSENLKSTNTVATELDLDFNPENIDPEFTDLEDIVIEDQDQNREPTKKDFITLDDVLREFYLAKDKMIAEKSKEAKVGRSILNRAGEALGRKQRKLNEFLGEHKTPEGEKLSSGVLLRVYLNYKKAKEALADQIALNKILPNTIKVEVTSLAKIKNDIHNISIRDAGRKYKEKLGLFDLTVSTMLDTSLEVDLIPKFGKEVVFQNLLLNYRAEKKVAIKNLVAQLSKARDENEKIQIQTDLLAAMQLSPVIDKRLLKNKTQSKKRALKVDTKKNKRIKLDTANDRIQPETEIVKRNTRSRHAISVSGSKNSFFAHMDDLRKGAENSKTKGLTS